MIAPAILGEHPSLNEAQREIISHTEGALLVIAGPGSGKTLSLVLRAANIMLLGKAKPVGIVLCTFTEKAAYELRDRISSICRKVGYKEDLSELRVGTIHSICNQFISQHRHRTRLGSGYETLDELGQLLFLFEQFATIVGEGVQPPFLGKWKAKWPAIEGFRDHFNKITEELVDPQRLRSHGDPFLQQLGEAYLRYQQALFDSNFVDFAHQQRIAHELLLDKAMFAKMTADIRYVLVDEYQDTNRVQEQLLLRLAAGTGNICAVGDEDQSIYRFRGATVRNILEFPSHFPSCKRVNLVTNYRSHRRIIAAYDQWMASADWKNPRGPPFRYNKTILPDPNADHPDYPAVFCVWGTTPADEGARFAEFVAHLKSSGTITDYSQVALLLHSVRQDHSGHYVTALEKAGIKSFCPRGRTFFDNEEIRLLVGCFAVVLGYHGDHRGDLMGDEMKALGRYTDGCLVELSKHCKSGGPLAEMIRGLVAEIGALKEGQHLDLRLADVFYRVIACPPCPAFLQDENRARNLAILSQLLNSFQRFYRYTSISLNNLRGLRLSFFNSFLRLLHAGGINEYEDPEQPLPKGHVQIMTIHQAKGLEFPVVAVGSLSTTSRTQKSVDATLASVYERPAFEPSDRITMFDRMRQHYVAFSRAAKILVLTAHEIPKKHFNHIWQGLPQWPYVEQELIGAQRFTSRERSPVKRRFSFTGDLTLYETCPRQYQFFREYDFTPSRSAVIFFGLLVHQSIEEIHRVVLDGRLSTLDDASVRAIFDRTYRFLSLSDIRPIGPDAREEAFTQVLNYFKQNRALMERVRQTEVDVSLEKDGYILQGKVDLLLGADGELEIMDFKTSKKPRAGSPVLEAYQAQLCTYAHILEGRTGRRPKRLLLYWTPEARRDDALTSIPFDSSMVLRAASHFEEVVQKIQGQDFAITRPPDRKTCRECDLKRLCATEGRIAPIPD